VCGHASGKKEGRLRTGETCPSGLYIAVTIYAYGKEEERWKTELVAVREHNQGIQLPKRGGGGGKRKGKGEGRLNGRGPGENL